MIVLASCSTFRIKLKVLLNYYRPNRTTAITNKQKLKVRFQQMLESKGAGKLQENTDLYAWG